MIRVVAPIAAVWFVIAGVAAQGHPQGHPGTQQHPPGHVPPSGPMDPALPALLHSTWNGTLTAAKGATSPVTLKVATDKDGKAVLAMTGSSDLLVGAASVVAVENHKLRWQLEMSGKPCQATADLPQATPHGPKTPQMMTGTLVCDQERMSFALTKDAK